MQEIFKVNQVAGSGKTTGLIKLINEHQEKKILFLTFSKVAIEDFERRLKDNDISPKSIDFATIHALAHRYLQYDFNYTIMSGFDQAIPVVSRKTGYSKLNISKFIPMYINGLFDTIEEELSIPKKRHDIVWDELVAVYEEYKKYSFNYIIYKFHEVFDVFQVYFEYDVIMIDEAQDLSVIQIEIIKKIIKLNANIKAYIVGDILQNIYKFRYSGPELITKMITSNETISTKAITYRCSNAIIDRANRLIDIYYDDKKDYESEFKVTILPYRNIEGKYAYIKEKKNGLSMLGKLLKKAVVEDKTFGILVRNNYQIREIIPLITDDIAKHSFIKEKGIFNSSAVSLFNEIRKIRNSISVNKLKLEDVKRMLLSAEIYSFKKQSNLFETIKKGIDNMIPSGKWKDYIKTMKSYNPYSFNDFKDNFIELLRNTDMYSNNIADSESFISFLKKTDSEVTYENKIAMASKLHNKLNKRQKIMVMTIHSSKGLEFDNVALYGMDYHLKDFKEEIKLMYVAVTRARDNIIQIGENELTSILI